METRKKELLQLQSHTNEIDAELANIFHHLQWDKNNLLENNPQVICKYDPNHRVPQECKERHEVECRLAHYSYSKKDKMLPAPLDNSVKTLIKLSKDEIQQIITHAALTDPSFKRGTENVDIEPQTIDRLQSTYTGDERRAIYDAVVQAAPFCHDLSDLALLSEQGHEDASSKQKSRLEILAELRDMKRRRAKYRVAAKTRNYSDVLRDVIKTQMELYSDIKVEKSETSSTNGKCEVHERPENNTSHRPKIKSTKSTTKYDNNYYKHKREHSSSKHDNEKPLSSKKAKYYDDINSSSKHKDYKDKRYSDDKKEKDRHSSRGSSRYENRSKGETRNDRSEEHRMYKRYEEDSSIKDSKKYGRNSEKKHRREKHYSHRDHDDERYEPKSYYNSHEHESRKVKKKYEYRK